MSGTSADGVDAVLLELPGWPALGAAGRPPPLTRAAPRARVVEHAYTPYPSDVREAVLRAARGEANTADITTLHFTLGDVLARAAQFLAPHADLIVSHGQTVQHLPGPEGGRRGTLQLGEAAVIADVTGRDVVADFRPADLAAGGQAAPLVPFADRILFAEAGVRRAVHNLGGISNLTYLPGLDAAGVLAFDTGPANALIDDAAGLAGLPFDEGGRLALAGRVDEALVHAWMHDGYLARRPPKSTGREHWNLPGLPGAAELKLNREDLVATVTTFSARTVADAYRRFVLPLGLDEVIVAGGGVRNPAFMAAWRQAMPDVPVRSFEEQGWAAAGFGSATREAAAFALLGYFARQGWPNTLPHTTGARRAVIAGKLTRAVTREAN